MRSNLLKSLILVLTMVGIAGTTSFVQAQAPIKLVQYTNSWKYFTNGTDLDTAWVATNYNDTAWPSGRGILGFEPMTNLYTAAPFNTQFISPATRFVTNVYFRTHFNFSANPCGVTLIASNYIDDGAVIYLNGVEIANIRCAIPHPAASFATAGPTTEGQFDVVAYTPPVGVLVQGDNVLAVEVHQVNATSSDIVWAMDLTATFGTVTPVAMAAQPQSATTPQANSTTFCIAATGAVPTYRWQRDNGAGVFTNIPNATATCYTIASTQPTNAGSYRCVVANCASSVTSSVATLTVVADLEGPRLVSAVMSDTPTNPTVVVTFNEAVTNVFTNANYSLTSVPAGSSLILSNAIGFNGATLLQLRVVGTWSTATNYVLTVNNIRDKSPNANLITTNSKIGVATWRDIMPYDSSWNYRDFVYDENLNPTIPVENWMSPSFNEYHPTNTDWTIADPQFGFGLAMFAFSFAPHVLPLPENTQLTYSSNSYYFRTRFVLATNAGASGSLKFNHVIDDGAVFYLNGREVYRYNMPPAPTPISFYTVASAAITDATELASPEITVTNLLGGTNLLAVEVHQQSADRVPAQTDAAFAAKLRASVAPNVSTPPRPRMTIARSGNAVNITWSDPAYMLQSATTVTGVWAKVNGAVSPYSAATGGTNGARRFYRLLQ